MKQNTFVILTLFDKSVRTFEVGPKLTVSQLKQHIFDKISDELRVELFSLQIKATSLILEGSLAVRDFCRLSNRIELRQTKNELTLTEGITVSNRGGFIFADMNCLHKMSSLMMKSDLDLQIARGISTPKCGVCHAEWDLSTCQLVAGFTKSEMAQITSRLDQNRSLTREQRGNLQLSVKV